MLLVVRADVESVDMGSAGLQNILQVGVNCRNLCLGIKAQGDAALIRNHNHADSRPIQPCHSFGTPGSTRKSDHART